MLGVACHERHDLYSRGSGADHSDTLVPQLVQTATRAATGVLVVPSAAVELPAFELLNTWDTGKFGPVQRSATQNDESGADFVAAVGVHHPPLVRRRPANPLDLCLEMGVCVEAELVTYSAQMCADFFSRRVFRRRRIAELFEQRDVDQRFAVTGYAGIPVPVPRSTEARGFLD